jgi:Tol biopolymer transport system component
MNTMGRGFRVAITLLFLISANLGEEAQGQRMPDAATTERVSVAGDGTEGNNASDNATISADGLFVAFHSYADNLVQGDSNGVDDVFVHNRVNSETRLVSVASDGTQGNNQSGIYGSSISGDGRYVAFESAANNLVVNDTNGRSDIFVHDIETGMTTRVSVSSGGAQADGFSYGPVISADGSSVAFYSDATNLVNGDTLGKSDVFLHNVATGETMRISVSSDGTEANGNSWLPAISQDGGYIAFLSLADNLVSEDNNAKQDVFIHDLASGETTRVSIASDGSEGNNDSGSPAITADGRFVAFESSADNLVIGDENGAKDIFVHDRLNGETSLVSVSSGGEQGDVAANFPAIAANGRYVVFDSWSSNLVPDDTNLASDIFIRDLEKEVTLLVSLSSDGVQGDYGSGDPSISADGRYTAFYSAATTLVISDTNATWDIFVRDQGEEWFTYSITGTVTEESGAPLSGVLISCDCGTSGATGLDGSYLISDMLSGTYTLTATLDGYIFSPGWQVVSVPPDAAGVNFAATRENLLTALPIVIK